MSDIHHSIELIEGFVKDLKSFDEYKSDMKSKAADERHLGIVGEAVNKLRQEAGVGKLKNASQLISLRNRLVHSYDSIDDSIIWSIISKYLSPLKQEVLLYLSQG